MIKDLMYNLKEIKAIKIALYKPMRMNTYI